METERKQQTAVEWLEGEFVKLEATVGVHGVMYELIEKAKEMEKEQIAEAFDKGENPFADDGKYLHGTDYYEETYKSGTE